MNNLAGMPKETANLQVRAELAQAGILAYGVIPRRELEVKADTVGVLVCPHGTATFTRAWYYWVVRLSEPLIYEAAQKLNQKWSEKVRVDGYAGGKEPDRDGVRVYHVDSQAGLNALVAALADLWGAPETRLPSGDRYSDRVSSFVDFVNQSLDWTHPGLYLMPAPATQMELAELQISALSLLGGTHDDPCYHLRSALEIAGRAFGKTSHQVRSVRKDIANTLRSRINHLRSVCDRIKDGSDRYVFTWQLEEALTERAAISWRLGRGKEARAVKQERDAVRTQLVILMQAEIDDNAKCVEAVDTGIDADRCDLAPLYRYRRAATTWSLGRLQKRRNQTAEADRLFDEALRLAGDLNEMYSQSFVELVKKTA